ncbi:MAG: PAS domain S-box protein [Bacillota bacterium]|nr:PAS domain S-box protein [Bacillota bacterium]
MEKIRSAEELRRRAEKQLQKSKPKVAVPLTQEEMQRFIQELEVYQIELEMQNDELHQARLELERSLSRYTDLYDFAPVGYFSLNQKGVILNVNLTGTRMLGIERSLIHNQYLDQYIDAEYRNEFLSFLDKVFLDHNQKGIEIVLHKNEHVAPYVYVEAIVMDDRQECRLALVDISAQKKAEAELREREVQYRTLFETMSQGVVYQDSEGTIIMANPAAEKILGLPVEQMQGRKPKDFHWVTVDENELDFPEELHPYMVALRTGETVNDVVMGFHSPKTGRSIWLNITAVPQFLSDENKPNQVVITFDDITYQKRMVIYNKLTSREKEVFKLLVKGHSRQTIAEILKFSPKTADKHKENLMLKLKLQTKEDILEFATFIRLI